MGGEGIQAWLEWEMEAMRWRVPIEISKDDLEALVEGSGVSPREGETSPPAFLGLAAVGIKGRQGNPASVWDRLVRAPGLEEVGADNCPRPRCNEDLAMRRSYYGRARDIAPLGERAGIILKALHMVFNERNRR